MPFILCQPMIYTIAISKTHIDYTLISLLTV